VLLFVLPLLLLLLLLLLFMLLLQLLRQRQDLQAVLEQLAREALRGEVGGGRIEISTT
jgi:Flp pilus assembly protein TadG